MRIFIVLIAFFNLVLNSSSKNVLNIHIVPHSHNDVGWLKTPIEYYFGLNNSKQSAEVRLILDSVMDSLARNPNRTFIYDVMYYFSWWYKDLSKEYKAIFNKYLMDGQFEFINGGMVSNDEACPDYLNIIDQMTNGLLYLKKTFNSTYRPTIAWQMDPFGHSLYHATLSASMAFKALFVGRVPHTFKSDAEKARTLEFDWILENISSYKSQSSIFTIISPNGYSPPDGFCFDFFCGDEPVIDYKDYANYKEKVEELIQYCQNVSTKYRTNNVLLTMGNDFNYQVAAKWYTSLDLLIKYGNRQPNVNFFYSTPRRYYDALVEAHETFSTYNKDLFPYTSKDHSVWTGFFSSRPLFKYYVRKSTEYLRACKQLSAFNPGESMAENNNQLSQALDVAQHHDAITGTAKQFVSDYYVSELYKGIEDCKATFNQFSATNLNIQDPIIFCDNMNVSSCEFTSKNSEFTLILYNQNSMAIDYPISIPVMRKAYSVYSEDRQKLKNTVVPSMKISELEKMYPQNSYMLHFSAPLKPLSFSIFNVVEDKTKLSSIIQKISNGNTKAKSPTSPPISVLENKYYKILFNTDLGIFVSVLVKLNSKTYPVSFSQGFYYYNSSVGDEKSKQTSGAYIFRPNSSHVIPCNSDSTKKACQLFSNVKTGFHEIQCNIGICRQTIRLWEDSRLIQVNYAVGPLNDKFGTEVILRWNTDISSQGLFYTDSNGRSMIRRERVNAGEEITARNYYPVVKYIALSDSKLRFTVFTDRTLGGASQSSGSLELMLHRRMFLDDFYGVEEALNETYFKTTTGVISAGNVWFTFSEANNEDDIVTSLGYTIQRPPIIGFSNKNSWKMFSGWSWVNYSLPNEIKLLSFERYSFNNSNYLIRFENPFSTTNKEVKEASFDILKFLSPIKVKCIKEHVLSGDIVVKLGGKRDVNCCGCVESQLIVDLKPLEIRTFIVSTQH